MERTQQLKESFSSFNPLASVFKSDAIWSMNAPVPPMMNNLMESLFLKIWNKNLE
ncbi:hypothetical protein [Clostridioides difficile]|uniref:hypothetical protein n=1 Tax=Clostridioides difficile TaxID=1496 RepID=UPI00235936B2|nr:hypothetical protein [Clostridioides difficile]MDC9295176.1 hypothetical protein [Clostridioides difficile]